MKKKKYFNILIYFIELLLSIVFSKNLLNIIISKFYLGFFPKLPIVLAGFSGIFIILIVIYLLKKDKLKIEKIFIVLAIPISILYAFLVLPFNVPDEGTHLIKAYDISNGNIFANVDSDKNSYCTIPRDLENYSYQRFDSYKDVYDELKKEINYEDEVQIACNAQGNFPILYTGVAFAILICKVIKVNIFYALYLGRIFNAIIYIIFGYFSIKKMPMGKLALGLILLFPMLMQQAASCSADAIINSVLIFYIVNLLEIVLTDTELTMKKRIKIYIFTMFIAVFKYIYIIVAGIIFVLPFNKKENRKQYIKTIIIMIIFGSICTIGWFLYTSSYKSVPDVIKKYNKTLNVDSGKQIEYIKNNPIKFGKVMTKEFTLNGYKYFSEAVGSKLGWLEVNINEGIIVLYIVILIISTISEENKYEINWKSKIWLCTIYFAISFLVKLSMYIFFTPVGLEIICGVQGRYYSAIIILPILCLIKKENNWNVKKLYGKMFGISTVLSTFVLLQIIVNYI